MSTKRKTKMGTPCSGNWTEEWIAQIDYTERQLNRRICGCHTMAATPCKLSPATLTGHAGHHAGGSTSTSPGASADKTGSNPTHSKSTDNTTETRAQAPHTDRQVGNGRCRFHGGVEGIGAPLGNRNAVIHGLYARRIQRCGIHCSLWQHCPMAGKDVLALDPIERPHCVYERDEYQTLTSLLRPTTSDDKPKPEPNPHPPGSPQYWAHRKEQARAALRPKNQQPPAPTSSPPTGTPAHVRSLTSSLNASSSDEGGPNHADGVTGPSSKEKVVAGVPLLQHNVAMYQVMLTRAQAALGIEQLVDESRADGDKYSMRSTKVSALLQAQLRIGRELRQWIRMLANTDIREVLGLTSAKPDTHDDDAPSLAAYMQPIMEQADDVIEDMIADSREQSRKRREDKWNKDDPDLAPA